MRMTTALGVVGVRTFVGRRLWSSSPAIFS
jgi:hypothetical protein